MVDRKGNSRDGYFWIVKNTPFTFKSMTLSHPFFSSTFSNSEPHVAPALANRISTWSVCFLTSSTSLSISLTLELSAGTLMAFAPGARLGSALSAATASSHALVLRDVMNTFEQPAWSRPDAACSPRPREPPDTTATLPSSRKMVEKSVSWTSAWADMVVEMEREGFDWG